MVFQVAKKAGFMSHNHQAVHVNFGSVLDTDGKVLKSREGEVIKLHDLLEEAIRRAKQSIDDKNPDLLGKEREEVARAVGIGAVKYADLSTERTKDYVFDWEKMLSFEGNTAPYLQYAYARISSIFRKWGGDRESLTTNLEPLMESELSNLRSEEILLSRRLVEFPSILDDSVSTFSPHKLCKHLHSIASSFASFYENCGILKEDDEAISRRRLALCEVTSRELKLGLEMMGINVPERM
jgi:arginyl-tRNA synthetase